MCWSYCEDGRQLGGLVMRSVRNASLSLRWWILSHQPWVLHRWQRKGWGRWASLSSSGRGWESSTSSFSAESMEKDKYLLISHNNAISYSGQGQIQLVHLVILKTKKSNNNHPKKKKKHIWMDRPIFKLNNKVCIFQALNEWILPYNLLTNRITHTISLFKNIWSCQEII